jgi:hypothetical protein
MTRRTSWTIFSGIAGFDEVRRVDPDVRPGCEPLHVGLLEAEDLPVVLGDAVVVDFVALGDRGSTPAR